MPTYQGRELGTLRPFPIPGGQKILHKWTTEGWIRVKETKIPEPSIASVPGVDEDSPVTPEWKSCLIIGESLDNDTGTLKELCPKCGGGESKDKAFSISRDSAGHLYWKCFRASCGYRGSTGGGSKGRRTVSREVTPLEAKLLPLTEEQTDYFSDEYGVDNVKEQILWAPEREAFAFKIRDSRNEQIGHVLRWYDGRKPKSLSYPESRTKPFMAAYPSSSERGAVIVEDPLSALKVQSVGVYAFSLLGTHFDYERAYEVRSVAEHLILALDKGTLDLALSYRDKFGSLFSSVTVWCLDKDLKYVIRERIIRAITKGDTDFITSR